MLPNRPAVALALILSCRATAFGQTRGDQPQLAASHYQTGNAEYRAGHFREAATEFRAAYQLSHEPALLFNAGSALYDAGDFPAAREAFEQYLRALPNAPNRGIVAARIDSIRQRMAAVPAVDPNAASTTPAANPVVTTTVTATPANATTPIASAATTPVASEPAPSEPAASTPMAPIVVTVAGVVVLAAAGVFYGLRSGPLAQCTDAPEAYYCPDEATVNSVTTYNTLTNVALGVGGVALVAGIVWLLASRGGARPRAHTSIGGMLSPSGGVLTLGGAF